MADHPILFSAPMVLALLDGRKTQTRRLVKPGLSQKWLTAETLAKVQRWASGPDGWWGMAIGSPGMVEIAGHSIDGGHIGSVRCLFGVVGDRLWVRETWCCPGADSDGKPIICYRATNDPVTNGTPWRPSIFMKREHSRLLLEVTEVRVQRLQDLSEEDAKAEGVEPRVAGIGDYIGGVGVPVRSTCVSEFSRLWDEIN